MKPFIRLYFSTRSSSKNLERICLQGPTKEVSELCSCNGFICLTNIVSLLYFVVKNFPYSQVNIIRVEHIDTTSYDLRNKFIIKPRQIFETGMHNIHRGVNGTKSSNIRLNEGLSFYYADKCLHNLCRRKTVIDTTARKFGKQLWINVNDACKKIFKNGICPKGPLV